MIVREFRVTPHIIRHFMTIPEAVSAIVPSYTPGLESHTNWSGGETVANATADHPSGWMPSR